MAHVSESKKQELSTLKHLMQEYSKIGIIDLTSLPSAQLQSLRSKLKDKFLIRVTKKSLIVLALDSLKDKKPGIENLKKVLENCMPALLLTNGDPFEISKLINKNKSTATAKPGQLAPIDLIIPAGPTSFTPGPIIGELGQVGLKTGIEQGKIVIKQDHILVRKGEAISAKTAEILTKFNIKPILIKLNLVAMFDQHIVYNKEDLDVDEEKYMAILKTASLESFNLAVYSNYITEETISYLIKKSYNQIKALASHIKFEIEETKEKKHEEQVEQEEIKGEKIEEKSEEENFVGFSEESVDKVQEILKNLQDQKMKEDRT